jgi:hypothetical protein
MKRRSLIKGLALLPGASVLPASWLDGLSALGAEKPSSHLERVSNEFTLLLPGEKEILEQPIRVNRIVMERASIEVLIGGVPKTIQVGESLQGWNFLTILPWHNGFPVAVLEKHVTHQGVIAFVTAEREIARIPKQIGDLSKIKPRLSGVREVKFTRPETNSPRPDTLGEYILSSNEDPSYENVAALGAEYTGWTLVSDEGVGPLKSLWLEADGTSREFGDNPISLWAPDVTGKRFEPLPLLPLPYLYAYKPGFSKRTMLGGFLPAADIGVWNPDNKVGYEVMMVLSPGPERKPMARIRATLPAGQAPVFRAIGSSGVPHVAGGFMDRYWNCTPEEFWDAALGLWQRWTNFFDQQMEVDIPDPWLLQAAKAGIVLCRCSYRGLEPTYQIGEGGYTKIPERSHALFPVAHYEFVWAQQLWNLTAQVEPYFQHYLDHYVLPNGNFVYNTQDQVEAPLNTGVFLQNSARAYDYTGDVDALRQRLPVLRRMIAFVMARRDYDKRVFPESDPRHGLIWGCSEADNGDPNDDTPDSHLYYYENSAWIWRGLKEHGRCLQRAGADHSDKALIDEGAAISEDAKQLRADVERSLRFTLDARSSELKQAGITPFSAFDTKRKPSELTSYENHRYMMDWWTADWGDAELDLGHYRHRVLAGQEVLGMNVATDGIYNVDSGTLMTSNFMEHGTLAHRIRLADYRPFLLTLYGNLCYAMDSGSRYAPEDALIPGSYAGEGDSGGWSAVINSELQPTMALRWLLCYEENDQEIVHLQKAAPKHWFETGKRIAVKNCPTRFGSISWTSEASHEKGEKGWTVAVQLAKWQAPQGQIVIHLHPPDGSRLKTASVGQVVDNSVVIPASALAESKQLSIRVT